jgi:uncharacterized protein YkwD
MRFTPDKVGTYIVEINSDEGFAVLNSPLYHRGFAPLLPDYFDLHTREETGTPEEINLKRDRLILLKMINAEREKWGLQKVNFEDDLDALAQFRSDDMAKQNYFSHTTPEGEEVNDFALDFGVVTSVSENIARDISLESAHEGLMRSAIHRRNILNSRWTYVGIGLSRGSDGGVIVTELFSEEPLVNSKKDEYKSEVISTIEQLRQDDIVLDADLSHAAEKWAELQSYNDTTDKNFRDVLNEFEIYTSIQAITYTNTSFPLLLEKLKEGAYTSIITEKKYRRMGIGIYVDEEAGGIITVVLMSQED